ncbi:outer membrane lipoprotein LolB [Taylorella equigenitalis]|uniref:Outer-membrane lipoprotein LolB n=1 Tax=Taylorella equigenitalis 14/56 TaxID=1091497 RepID=I7IB60_9BURK|nr:outer membrane lipoprotein LolB [Taylorella equigenitalis]ASY37404.1 outer membrane lipoprotein LolB [Taylorella equigenitalis]ASY41828.1 outer membrane lipoprotein LolB [Taylorella equigenitalis]KGK33379.1 molecular chaperone LolB [Taylorella equigenitalis]RBA25894.1 outer membrane lipoprotein LolB [Taylorella equigenitalis]WDU46694.1 outer membrane lipoprotein LolB [Taylorella equigenitalis]
MKIINKFLFVAFVAFVATLASCASVEGPQNDIVADGQKGAKEQSVSSPQEASEITRHGKFVLNTFDKAEDRYKNSLSGNFDWIDSNGLLLLTLTATTGQTIATIKVNSVEAVLTDAKGQVLEASTAEELMVRAVGQKMPVSDIRNWIRGKISSNASNVKRDSNSRIVEFMQSDWNVQLLSYDAVGPKRVNLHQDKDGIVTTIRISAR